MTHKYILYQINDENTEAAKKLFEDWQSLIKEHGKFNIKDYNKVYEGEIEGGNSTYFVLEDLFTIFNIRHPEDFKGHSLSVSDVIDLDGELWYCDSYCWHKIENDEKSE